MSYCGIIYRAVNTVNGKTYIGQTRGSVDDRWKSHVRHARQSRKNKCHALARSIIKYGESSFDVQPIFYVFKPEDLDFFEKKFIAESSTLHPNGLNLTEGGASPSHTQAIKDKISSSVKKIWENSKHRMVISLKNSKPVVCRCIKTGVERYFTGIKQAQQVLKINGNNITSVINGARHHAGGFQWKYADQADFVKKVPKPRPLSRNRIPIIATNIQTGEVLSFPSMRHAESFGFSSGSISIALRKKSSIYKGYIWTKASETKG